MISKTKGADCLEINFLTAAIRSARNPLRSALNKYTGKMHKMHELGSIRYGLRVKQKSDICCEAASSAKYLNLTGFINNLRLCLHTRTLRMRPNLFIFNTNWTERHLTTVWFNAVQWRSVQFVLKMNRFDRIRTPTFLCVFSSVRER